MQNMNVLHVLADVRAGLARFFDVKMRFPRINLDVHFIYAYNGTYV